MAATQQEVEGQMGDLLNPLKILAVIPSLSINRLNQIEALNRVLQAYGIDSLVVANGRKLDKALEIAGIARLTPHKNLGFGAL